jgi:hypothetical protein
MHETEGVLQGFDRIQGLQEMPEKAPGKGSKQDSYMIYHNNGNILDLDQWIEISKKDLEK